MEDAPEGVVVVEDDGVGQLLAPGNLISQIGLLVGAEVAHQGTLNTTATVLRGKVTPAVLVETLRGDSGGHFG